MHLLGGVSKVFYYSFRINKHTKSNKEIIKIASKLLHSITIMSTTNNIILSDDILAPFLGNMCSSFSMNDMNLAQQQCEAVEELPHDPFLAGSSMLYWLVTHILGWSVVAAAMLFMLGGLEVKLFSEQESIDVEDDDDDEKYKKLLTRGK